jgi:hypothetical protein
MSVLLLKYIYDHGITLLEVKPILYIFMLVTNITEFFV